jgi:hypothetical protein
MSWIWFLAAATTALAAALVAWSVLDLRRRAAGLADEADRFRALSADATALGRDVDRLRARAATVEARAASGGRPGAG